MVTLSIVIPCYNEEEGLPQLFSQIKTIVKRLKSRYILDFVFVDDGSRDNTFRMLSRFKKELSNARKGVYVKIIRHKTNKNLGSALKTAFKNIKGDLVVTADADCTYSILDIPKLLSLLDDETDIVAASPYHPKGSSDIRPKYRLWLSKITSKIYAIITRSDIHSFTPIFRVYRREVIDKVKIRSRGFLAVTELLIYSIKKGYRIKEMPARLRVRKYGQSNMRLASTIGSHFILMIKLLLGM
tara:strand:+ start:2984 stop:3709 length:726 start_codon:yes stop_codon:yes gene_type:complete